MLPRISLASIVVFLLVLACGGSDRPPGEIEGARRPDAALEAAALAQKAAALGLEAKSGAAPALPAKRILFGDFHVHTTYSIDTRVAALFYSLIESAKLAGVEPRAYLRKATLRAVRNPGTVTLARDLKSSES
jgi:hypothetical protein